MHVLYVQEKVDQAQPTASIHGEHTIEVTEFERAKIVARAHEGGAVVTHRGVGHFIFIQVGQHARLMKGRQAEIVHYSSKFSNTVIVFTSLKVHYYAYYAWQNNTGRMGETRVLRLHRQESPHTH